MKKAISTLWIIFIVCIVIFIISVFVPRSEAGIWYVFAIVIPMASFSMWGAIILTVIDYLRSWKK